jgi:alpha-mannosidase
MKLRYPTRLGTPVARWECAYGSVARATDGSEQPLHGYLTVSGDLAGAPAGLAIAVDGPTAGDVDGAEVGLTLARSPLYAWHDPAPAEAAADPRYLDLGEHEFTLRLVPFTPDPRRPVPPVVTAAAADLVHPVTVLREGAHPGPLPPRGSFAAVLAGTADLAVLKQPEDPDRDATLVRVFETSGAPTMARIRLGARVLHVSLGAHRLRTLRVPYDRAEDPVELDLCEWVPDARPPVQPCPPTIGQAP